MGAFPISRILCHFIPAHFLKIVSLDTCLYTYSLLLLYPDMCDINFNYINYYCPEKRNIFLYVCLLLVVREIPKRKMIDWIVCDGLFLYLILFIFQNFYTPFVLLPAISLVCVCIIDGFCCFLRVYLPQYLMYVSVLMCPSVAARCETFSGGSLWWLGERILPNFEFAPCPCPVLVVGIWLFIHSLFFILLLSRHACNVSLFPWMIVLLMMINQVGELDSWPGCELSKVV